MYKILIASEDPLCKSLIRALTKIDFLRKQLLNFAYSVNTNVMNIEDYINCHNSLSDLEKTLEKEEKVGLLIITLDYNMEALRVISKIRLGSFGEKISSVPIILISALEYERLKNEYPIVRYLKSDGVFVEVPFYLRYHSYNTDSLEKCLRAAWPVSKQTLEQIRKNLYPSVISDITHPRLTKDNYEQIINDINEVTKGSDLIKKYSVKLEKLNKMVQELKDGTINLNELQKEIDDFCKEVNKK